MLEYEIHRIIGILYVITFSRSIHEVLLACGCLIRCKIFQHYTTTNNLESSYCSGNIRRISIKIVIIVRIRCRPVELTCIGNPRLTIIRRGIFHIPHDSISIVGIKGTHLKTTQIGNSSLNGTCIHAIHGCRERNLFLGCWCSCVLTTR